MSKLVEYCRICIALVCVSAFGMSSDFVQAQVDEATMKIGSQAPDLDIKHWFSDNHGLFQHTTKLEADHIYVIEFWATWCEPCIVTMPFIAKLQAKYDEQNVQFIAISDEDIDSIEGFLERKVPGDREKRSFGELTSSYCLTSDPDKSVKIDYFRAAKQSGIPCAFIVGKTGLIEWIGPTTRLDEPLAEIVEDQWDRDDFSAQFDKQQAAQIKATMLRRTLIKTMNRVDALVANGESKKAIEVLDALLINEELGETKSVFTAMRLRILIESSLRRVDLLAQRDKPEEAIALIDELLKEKEFETEKSRLTSKRLQIMIASNAKGTDVALSKFAKKHQGDSEALNSQAWAIYVRYAAGSDVDMKILEQAKIVAEFAVQADPDSGAILDTLAHLIYVVDGDLDQAIEVQTRAVKWAGFQYKAINLFLTQLKQEKKTGQKALVRKTTSDF